MYSLVKTSSDNVRPLKVIFGSKDDATNLVTTFNEAKRQGVSFPLGPPAKILPHGT